VATVLSFAKGAAWINEPDNEWPNLFALKAKRDLGRFPVLEAGEAAPRAYEQLWDRALGGYRPGRYREALAWKLDQGERTMADLWMAMCDQHPRMSPRLRLLTLLATPPSIRSEAGPVMVKSVHAPLALEWIAERFRPRLLVVLRHPLNVIASWMELGWGGCALETNPTVRYRFGEMWSLPELDGGSSRLHRVAWEVGLFTSALQAAADRHPEWLVAPHETLCRDPEAGFRRIYERLGLEWQGRANSYLEESNRPGTGWSMSRVLTEQPESWRRRLSAEQVRDIWSVLSRFRAPWVGRLARDVE